MEDMLAFVSRKIKSQDSLSMQELIEKMGLTRSMFYRYTKEPWRFSDSDFDKLSEILSLSNEEKGILRSFKNIESSNLTSSGFDENKTYNEEDRINEIIHKLIFEPTEIKPTSRNKAYTLFGSSDDQLSQLHDAILKCSTDDIISRISSNLAKTPSDHDKPFINIYVFNTYSEDKVYLPYELIKAIYNIENITNIYDIRSLQIINKKNMSLIDQFEVLKVLQCIYCLGNHDIKLPTIEKEGIASLDCCIIEYIDKTKKTRYSFIIFNSTDGALIYEFESKSFFEFLCYEFNQYLSFDSTISKSLANISYFNSRFAETTIKYKTTSIEPYLCVDNFIPEIYKTIKLELASNSTSLKELRSVFDVNGDLKGFSDSHFLNEIYDSFIGRYMSNEENESTNLIHATGLMNFADTGSTIETKKYGIKIDNYLIIEELKYIKSRLGNTFAGKGQRFYVIRPRYCKGNFYMCNFKDYAVGFEPGFEASQIQPFSFFFEKEMTIAIHNYIHDVILQKENRKEFNSPIYTDERAAEFIDSLINDVKAKMGK